MQKIRFLHAADLHIDSPLKGLETLHGAPADRIREATRRAFENLVQLAIDEAVDFVVIAGDLFDGKWPDASTGHWTSHQFRRLEQQRIPVYCLRGNHDAEVRNLVSWPANVFEFPTDRPSTIADESLGVALHGQGFAQRDVKQDLAAGYPAAVEGLFNIGVLHTSLTGDPFHDNYAPTTEATLTGKGYDYWALGHIHARRVICERPYIAYSGNTQGRHAKETGAKGCLLVEVNDRQVEDVQFRPLDTVRWSHVKLTLQPEDNLSAVFEQLREAFAEQHAADDGRLSAMRVFLEGGCDAHQTLSGLAERAEAEAEIRNIAASIGDAWVEKILVNTSAPTDRSQRREAGDLIGVLLRHIDELGGDDDALMELAHHLTPLTAKAALELRQAGVDCQDPEQIRIWVRRAESLLVSRLWEVEA